MKKTSISLAVFSACFLLACSKSDSSRIAPAPSGAATGAKNIRSLARLSSAFSKSIPVDSANVMLGSYLASVGYPTTDTSLRSLSFDADTLRAYLQNPNIVTIKLMLAHTPTQSSMAFGVNGGMKPATTTMIMVGLDNDDAYVLNTQGGVYDYMSPCPHGCPGNSSGYIAW